MNNMHTIARATPADFHAIGELNVNAYAEFAGRLPAGGWEMMQRNLRNIGERSQTAEFLACRQGEALVGSVAYCPPGKGDVAIFRQDMAAVLLLAVHPDCRGQGVARALTEACIARARQDQAASIGLFTSELMLAAQALYRSLGFQMESELPSRQGIRFFRFVLALEPAACPV